MANNTAKIDTNDRVRATALRQAHEIEDRKKLKASIMDLILEAYDLPSLATADPAHPLAADAALFKKCLSLWQPSDLDDLIYERNIDDRCGYALCARPNTKVPGGGEKVWNQKGGKDFKLVDKAELEKWCSTACKERTTFVRAQLDNEPAWLRDIKAVDIKLLDEVGSADNLSDSLKALSMSPGVDEEMAKRLQALALERGDSTTTSDTNPLAIIERENSNVPVPPSLTGSGDLVEGHRTRNVRFQDS